MNNIVIISVLSILCISFAISYLAVKKQLQDTQDLLAETFEANFLLTEQLTQGGINEDTTHKENFIKYLSDSRDWAFNYIETSQTTIKEVAEGLKNTEMKNYADKLFALLPEVTEN